MPDNFENSLAKTMKAYREHVEPFIHKYIAGELIPIEGKNDELADMFDKCASIDIIQKTDKGLSGVASRIQFGHNWRTFTVRQKRESGSRTEYEKLDYALEHHLLCPRFTYQAYIEDGKLSGMAVIQTADLIDYIKKHNPKIKKTGSEQKGQAWFYVCPRDDIKKNGYRLLEYTQQKEMKLNG